MSTNNPPPAKQIPKDAQVIISILKDMGITDFEPQAITQLLEFTYRYVTSTLEDAKVYAAHANKKVIDVEDVQLAVNMQLDKNFTTPPPRDMLLEVARTKNSIPLPQIRPHCGIRLPPDRYCMTACNYELKSSKKPVQTSKPNSVYSSSQSPIFKPQTKPIIKRTMQTIARTQTVTIPKPVIKFTPGGAVTTSESSSQQWKPTIQQTVMEVDEPPASLIKRKMPDE